MVCGFDIGVFQTQQVFGVAEAAFTPPTPFVPLLGLNRAVFAIRDQMPDAPLPLTIPCPALRDVEPMRRAFAVSQSPEAAPPRVACHPQGAELTPGALEENFDVLLGADDKGDLQIIEQVKEQDIGKPPICSRDQLVARHIAQDDFEQSLDKGALDPAAMPPESSFVIRAPVDRHGAPPDDG